MSLLAIKEHMMRVKMTSLGSLCLLFGAEPETMRCLLSHWMHKGKIRQCPLKPACGTQCAKCPAINTELYEWIGLSSQKNFPALTCL